MTTPKPEEKLERIMNPKTIEDYSLCMNEEEFYKTKIGKEFIDALNEQKKLNDIFLHRIESAGKRTGLTLEKELFNILHGRNNDNT